jgi:hypothetical protein
VGLRAGLDVFGEDKKFLARTGIPTLDHPARSLVAIPNTILLLPLLNAYIINKI